MYIFYFTYLELITDIEIQMREHLVWDMYLENKTIKQIGIIDVLILSFGLTTVIRFYLFICTFSLNVLKYLSFPLNVIYKLGISI